MQGTVISSITPVQKKNMNKVFYTSNQWKQKTMKNVDGFLNLLIRKYRYKQTIKQNLRKFACTQKTTKKNWVNKTEQYQDKWLFQVDWLLAKKAKSLH
jgi:hypothetical protein